MEFKISKSFVMIFCLIKSRANHSGITQPFLNPNMIFFSNAPQIFWHRIIKMNQNKDFESSNLNILEVPMSWTSYTNCTLCPVGILLWIWKVWENSSNFPRQILLWRTPTTQWGIHKISLHAFFLEIVMNFTLSNFFQKLQLFWYCFLHLDRSKL